MIKVARMHAPHRTRLLVAGVGLGLVTLLTWLIHG
jgi:hypothetical protein